jgi:hypothetical protein
MADVDDLAYPSFLCPNRDYQEDKELQEGLQEVEQAEEELRRQNQELEQFFNGAVRGSVIV